VGYEKSLGKARVNEQVTSRRQDLTRLIEARTAQLNCDEAFIRCPEVSDSIELLIHCPHDPSAALSVRNKRLKSSLWHIKIESVYIRSARCRVQGGHYNVTTVRSS
jgi:hypothetical protein